MNFSGPDMSDLRLKVDHIMNVVMPDDEADKMANTELPENAPFFANNLSYYPRLQQRYNNWRRSHNKFQPQQEKAAKSQQKQQKEQEQQRSSFEAELWMLLGKNIAECIKQPSGQPLVSLTTMSTMSALDVANVLLSAHLLKQKQQQQQQQQREKQKDNGMQVNCVLSHYRDHEMRSYMLKSNDLRDVLQRCEQQMWRTSIYNAMPRQEPPMTQLMQMPPRQWLPSMRSMMWRLNRNNRQHNDIATLGNGNRRHRKQLAPLPLLRKTVEASQSEVPVRELQLLRLNRELGPGSELDTKLELEIEPELEMQRVPRTQPSFIYYRRNKKKLT
ncbi:putative uncharacterized protein DDB_G0271606 isoform X2 [Drosophila nasuta]|uniref:putative uncharacterized protein DDB_G0271606 isoform X2 n=1 Tax=Drosophila nasuta TaxID=42062 RepID=UPI00295F4386|nr:putative uncharacterized protein DDB_G0271606 isoform X2 [Drosophila nasuta]